MVCVDMWLVSHVVNVCMCGMCGMWCTCSCVACVCVGWEVEWEPTLNCESALHLWTLLLFCFNWRTAGSRAVSPLGLTVLGVLVIQQEFSEADTGTSEWHSAHPRADVTCRKHRSHFSPLVTCKYSRGADKVSGTAVEESRKSSLHAFLACSEPFLSCPFAQEV